MNTKLSAEAAALLVALTARADRAGRAQVSLKTLREASGLKPKGLRDGRDELESLRIVRTETGRSPNGALAATVWIIDMEAATGPERDVAGQGGPDESPACTVAEDVPVHAASQDRKKSAWNRFWRRNGS